MKPAPDDVVATITIRLHAHGAMSVSGNIGDKTLALSMLDHAKDAVRGTRSIGDSVKVPNYDVDAKQSPAFPTRELGDMPLADRGDDA